MERKTRDQTATKLPNFEHENPQIKLKFVELNGISKTLSLNHQTRVRNAIVVSNSAKRTLHHCHQFKPSLFRRILCLRTSNFEIRSIGEEIKTEVPQNRKKEGTETEQTKNSNCNGRKHNEEEEKERLSVSGENKVVIH